MGSIKAIFYAKFDPQEGPKVIHQVPEDSILSTSDISSSTIIPDSAVLSFPTISRYIIPRQSLCGNLISLTPPPLSPIHPQCLLLGYPILLSSPSYPRNEFIFNFTLVLSSTSTITSSTTSSTNSTDLSTIDIPSYKSITLKLAHLMRSLESQSLFLSSLPDYPRNTGPIHSLMSTLMQDLNNYAECMIPINALNTLHLKLFPTLPDPPKVQSWHVPLFTVQIATLMDENWDLTVQRVVPFINGVNSVKRISLLADADVKLARKAVRHLVYYGCCVLLDVFGFGNVYAPTSEFVGLIVKDEGGMQRECARYVNVSLAEQAQVASVDGSHRGSSGAMGGVGEEDVWPLTGKGEVVDGVGIVQLYANLRQGLTVREWYKLNANMLANIDLRRFITFGVIKGFLYRVHRYAVRTENGIVKKVQDASKTKSQRNGQRGQRNGDDRGGNGDEERDVDTELFKYLDGTHCFDEICTELEISERELVAKLNSGDFGDVHILCR